MPNLISRLIVELQDKTGPGAKSAAKNVSGIAAEMKKIQDQQKKIQLFKELVPGLTAAKRAAAEAQKQFEKNVIATKRAQATLANFKAMPGIPKNWITSAAKNAADLEKALEKEKKIVRAAANDVIAQRQRIREIWGNAPISFAGLEQKQKDLKALINQTTAALEAQAKAARGGPLTRTRNYFAGAAERGPRHEGQP